MRRVLLTVSATALLFLTLLSIAADSDSASAQGGSTPTSPAAVCSRTLANFLAVLERKHDFKPVTQPGSADYCAALEKEINTFVEAELLAKDTEDKGIAAESRGAFAFIDFGARQFVGIIPRGIQFKAVARNALPGSQMTFVMGDGFMVFVDYTFTTLTPGQFDTLPDYRDYDGPIEAFCGAEWCRPPGPPPTRTS